MNINDLKDVTVIGAAGKMGRGISLLLLQELASREAKNTGKVGISSRLNLIDADDHYFLEVRAFLRSHILKFAEKNINRLREYFRNNATLVSNEDIITSFVSGAMDMVTFDTKIDRAANSQVVFEAIIEDLDTKVQLYSQLDAICQPGVAYFTNTSSIPINVLQEKAQLDNRILGFHFYNPPHIQKLIEIIFPENIDVQLKTFAKELSDALGKTTVYSKDIAGFIGNGHFLREVVYALQKVDELKNKYSLNEAIVIVNTITQEFLIRPMGIFQLLDYVGLDVGKNIAKIMGSYIPSEQFPHQLIDQMLSLGIKGGQNPDGSQKDGFFKYEKNVIVGIYSLEEKKYIPFKGVYEKVESYLGKPPEGHYPWKKLVSDPAKQEKLSHYFQNLLEEPNLGSALAKAFLENSRQIANGLVKQKVCRDMKDLNTVLESGFYHLYGPEAALTMQKSAVI